MGDSDPKHNEEIEALVAASKKGNSEAYAQLYDQFVDPIYRYIFFRVGQDEAEDLTEMVFLKTWENIRQYEQTNKTFASWLFRIAHNVVIDYYRARRPEGELSENLQDERTETSAVHHANARFTKEMLGNAMKDLKDHYRQILVLKYVNELSNEEIAYITGRSHAALRILQFRALKKLRIILESRGISSEDL